MHQIVSAASQIGLPNPNEVESYNCRKCGVTIQRKFIGKPINKYIFPVCHCENEDRERFQEMKRRTMAKRNLERVYSQNLMNDDLQRARFETFQIRPGTEVMFREAKKFADNFEQQKSGLLGYGNPGNGKSHLFVSIHHQVDTEGFISLFLDCQRLFNIVEDARKYNSKINLNDIINAAIHCDLLTLDELGAGRLTQEDFTDVLFPIINGRQGKLTNFTTNLNLDELRDWFAYDKYGKTLDDKGRLLDRILGSCVILKNNGTSKRQEDAIRRLEG